MMWQRQFLGLAVGLALLPVAHSAETEIYVSIGPDGIETFSNLPRGPEGLRGKVAKVSQVIAASTMPAHQPANETETTSALDASRVAEIEASGKSFLLGD